MRPNMHCHLINGPFGDPAVYADVMFERRAFLFDLGDVSTLAPKKLLRVTHVFVSHAHMDHFAGFDHLLRLLLGREKLFRLYGRPVSSTRSSTSSEPTRGTSSATISATSYSRWAKSSTALSCASPGFSHSPHSSARPCRTKALRPTC